MADERLGIYFTDAPKKRKPLDWQFYLIGYIVPGLILLAVVRLFTLLLSLFV